MAKRMLISVDEEESRVAIIDANRLENLEIEADESEGRRGNIYKGIVHKVEPSLQAAFIDFGEEKQGFLPVSEIHERLWPKGVTDKRPDISQLLQHRQELMVQIVKDEIGTKGATLTTHVSLPGRYLVLMPETDKHGISRRISDTDRRRLKETVDSIGVPDGFGVIIRTAGREQRPLELKKDLLYLTKLYDTVEQKFGERKGPGLIYRDRSHAVRFVRDYFTDDIEEIWVNHRGTLKEISEFMAVLMPSAREKLRLYEGDAPLFIKFGVEDQIESVFARKVELPSGGSIVIDATEALVAIDVNSGRVKEKDIEETALTANLEAAQEIARQVIIRDLGGLLVLDFIDMRDRKNNRQVEQRLREAFADDKAKIKFGRISEFGLMEMSRQRLRKSLSTSVSRRCQACDGTGRVRAPASAGLSLLRRIEEATLKGGVKYIRATTPVAMANLLLNRRRKELMELERKLSVVVEVVAHADMPANLVALDIVLMKGGKAAPQRIYQLADLIRNEVVRRDTSPLPKPEDGLEALEFDHTAIYRAIADRDAELRAQQEAADDDFEFKPQEPIYDPDEKPAPRRQRARHGDRPMRDDEPSSDELDIGADREETPAKGPAPIPIAAAAVAPVPEKRGGGFFGWMRRIFGGGEEREAAPELAPITEEAVLERERRPRETPREPPRDRDRRDDRDRLEDRDRRGSRRRGRDREPRRGEGDRRPDRGDRPDRGPQRGDRPDSRGDRPAHPPRGERSGEPRGDRPVEPRGERPVEPRADRPAEPRGDRPAEPRGERPPRTERPAPPARRDPPTDEERPAGAVEDEGELDSDDGESEIGPDGQPRRTGSRRRRSRRRRSGDTAPQGETGAAGGLRADGPPPLPADPGPPPLPPSSGGGEPPRE